MKNNKPEKSQRICLRNIPNKKVGNKKSLRNFSKEFYLWYNHGSETKTLMKKNHDLRDFHMEIF